MIRHLVAWMVAGTLALVAADPTPPNKIKVPAAPAAVPIPGGVVVLQPDYFYVVEFDKRFVIRDHPKGYVKITYETVTGGLTLRGKFADDPSKVQTKTFKGPFLAFVEPVEGVQSRIEIDCIPFEFKDEGDIVTATIDVNGNQAPIPPPKPKPNPEPIPLPVTPDAWFIVVEETSLRTPAIAATLNFKLWDALPIEGRYRFYDKDSADTKKYKYDVLAASTSKPLPVLMAVKQDGTLIESKTLGNFDDVKAFVKKITGK